MWRMEIRHPGLSKFRVTRAATKEEAELRTAWVEKAWDQQWRRAQLGEYLGQTAAMVFRMLMTGAVWLSWLGYSANGQTKTPNSFWIGQQEVSVLGCQQECGLFEINDKGIKRYSNDMLSRYIYNVYQNDKGIVRRELVSPRRSGISEQVLGVELVDYPQGYVMAFDLSGWQAVRRPVVFPDTTSTPLDSREILGFKCIGTQRKWVQQRNQYRLKQETWTAAKTDFREPLFQVVYAYDPSRGLVSVEVRAMRSLKVSPPLEPFLFKLPLGYRVVELRAP